MLERKGRLQGEADGRADAALNLAKRPRPDLVLAVTFAVYRDAYLASYKTAYDAQRLVEERAATNRLTVFAAKPKPTSVTARDRLFDRGWKDGFEGRKRATWNMSAEDKPLYQRGHSLGQRHRDYDRAAQLRKSANARSQQRGPDRSR